MATIPAAAIVAVTPSVLSVGGTAIDTIGLFLTTNSMAPLGAVLQFADAADVGTYFGSGSTEAAAASIYFNGFEGSSVKPGALLMAQYNTAAVAGYLRGGDVSSLTLAQLQALTGTLVITFAGVVKTSSSINLSAAASFSAAATTIEAAFTTPGFTVTYDSTANAFKFTSTSTGATQTIIFATGSGTILTGLKLTSATGAVLSQGAAIAVPATFMAALIAVNRDWATFTTLFDPDASGNANKLLFARWVDSTGDQFAYACWDTDATPTTTVPATTSLGYLIDAANLSGTILIYSANYTLAAFACAWAASLNFEELAGRATLAFKGQSGLVASVTNRTIGDNLISNGYNFYGDYATATTDFTWFYPGSISGPFAWADSYINQISLNAALQLAGMMLFANTKSLPYNTAGYSLVEMALRDPILAAVNFGSIQPGVTLSSSQIAEVNAGAGTNIADTLSTIGWYLKVFPAAASVRVERQSPVIKLWYMDGQSIQQLEINSINVQ